MIDSFLQVVVGTLAIRGINLDLDPPPLEQFQVACNMFRSAAETSSRAARALVSLFITWLLISRSHQHHIQPVLQTMLIKAYQARQLPSGDTRVPVAAPDDEISIFGGRAEAIVRSPPSSPSPPRQNSPPEALPTPSRQATLRPPPAAPAPAPAALPEMAIPAPPLAGFDMGSFAADPRLSQQSWEGLFREAPGPAYIQHDYPMAMPADGGAMDDRWLSFMQNYNMLEMDEPQSIAYA